MLALEGWQLSKAGVGRLISSVIAPVKGTMYRQTSSSFSMEEAWYRNIWQLRERCERMQGK